jgi:hypothetical protein
MVLADDFRQRVAIASRKFWLAETTVPSMLNSITACDLLMASAWASASRALVLLLHKDTGKSFW